GGGEGAGRTTAGTGERARRGADDEMGARHDVHPAGQARLGEKHGAELARADEADGDRPAGSLPFKQHGVEIHGNAPIPEGIESLLQRKLVLSSTLSSPDERQRNPGLAHIASLMRATFPLLRSAALPRSMPCPAIGRAHASRMSRSDIRHRWARPRSKTCAGHFCSDWVSRL